MDAPNRHTMLDILSVLRVAYADLPAAQLAAILPQLAPETAARVQAFPVHRRNFVRQTRIAFVNNHLQPLAKNVG
jgi:hypothetical protein